MKRRKFIRRFIASLCAAAAVFAAIAPTARVAEATVSWGQADLNALHNPDGSLTLNDVTGIDRSTFVNYMESHKSEFIGIPYGASGVHPGNIFTCAVFVGYAIEKAGGRGPTSHYPEAQQYARWSDTYRPIQGTDLKRYVYWSKKAMLDSGVLEKGDIIVSLPAPYLVGKPEETPGYYDAHGNIIDPHVGFFWGETSSDDKYWHQQSGPDGGAYIAHADIYEYEDNNRAMESKTSGNVPRAAGSGITYIPMVANSLGHNDITRFIPKCDSVYIVVKWAESFRKLKLKKSSALPAISDNNRGYSLSGAVYGVYTDAGCATEAGRLTTKADGESNELELLQGDYWIREITAPKGFLLNTEVKKVSLGADTTVAVSDVPATDPLELLLTKADAESKKGKPLGGARLEGAEYTVKYYDTDSATDPAGSGAAPKYTWVMKTDRDGKILLDDAHKVSGPAFPKDGAGKNALPLGTLTIQEKTAPEGYLINSKVYVANTRLSANKVATSNLPTREKSAEEQAQRGDFSFRKIDADNQTRLANVSFELISLDAEGNEAEKHTITTDANGFYSSANSYAAHDKDTNSGKPGAGTWFGVDTNPDGAKGALPYGTYILREIRGEANEGYEMYEDRFRIYGDKVMINLGNIENRPTPEEEVPVIGTTAHNGNGSDVIFAEGSVSLTDTVEYAGFGKHKGKEVTFTGMLMDKASGEPLLDGNGKPITATAKKRIFNSSGSIDVVFVFDARGLGGADIVVFEKALDAEGEIIAEHEDIDDEGQTVHVRDMRTTATDGETNTHNGVLSATAVINDVIEYYKLPKEEIRFVGTLMRKSTGEPARDAAGGVITSETVAEITEDQGSVTVTFTFDSSAFAGEELVVFEEAYDAEERLVGWHKDINDEGQTVSYPEPTVVEPSTSTEKPKTEEKKPTPLSPRAPQPEEKAPAAPKTHSAAPVATGDGSNLPGSALMFLAGLVLLATVFRIRQTR